ncbi:MAG: IS5 family transposase [Magnetococcales bacterium]|nr:IS5 family transposase [Magnetococcales bacterium]
MDRLILRDDQWERIEKELPGKAGDPGKTAENNRLFVEGVLWIDRTGSPWRDLPTLFGNWNSVYQRFNRWSKKGIWNRLKEFVSDDPDLEEFLIDSSIIRVHQHAAGAQKKRGKASHRKIERREDDKNSCRD